MSTVTVDGLAVEISGIATKSTSSISDLSKAIKDLRSSFGGTSWKNAPENMKNAAKAINTLRNAIYSIDPKRMKILANVLEGIKNTQIRIDDAGTIKQLESKIETLKREINFLRGIKIDVGAEDESPVNENAVRTATMSRTMSQIRAENLKAQMEMEMLSEHPLDLSGVDDKNITEVLTNYVRGVMEAENVTDGFKQGVEQATKQVESSYRKITWKEFGEGVASAFKKATKPITSLVNGMYKIVTIAQTIHTTFKRVGNAIKKALQPAINIAKKVASAVGSLGKSFVSQFTEPVKNAIATVEKWKKSLLRIAVYRTMRTAIKELTQSLKEGINNMYEWASLNNNGFKTSMDSLATDVLYIKNSFASALAPAINAIIPLVTALANAFNTAATAVARLFAMISGQATFNAAKRSITEYDNGISDAAGSAEKLKNMLLGIDELNVLPDDSSSGGGSGSSLDYSDMFEEQATGSTPAWLEAFKSAWKAGDMKTAAQVLTTKLNSIITTWDSKSWAKKLGNKIKNGITFALEFLRGFSFESVGSSFAGALQGMMESISPNDLGALIAQKITSAVRLVSGFLQSMKAYINAGGQSVGTWLSKVVNGWFDEIDWETTGKTIGESIKVILDNMIDFIDGLDADKIISDIKALMDGINFSEIWGKVAELLETTKEKLGLSGILAKAFDVAIDIVEILGDTDLTGEEKWKELWETIGGALSDALTSDEFKAVTDQITDTLSDCLFSAISSIDWVAFGKAFVTALWTSIKNSGNNLGETWANQILFGDSYTNPTPYSDAGSAAGNAVLDAINEAFGTDYTGIAQAASELGTDVVQGFIEGTDDEDSVSAAGTQMAEYFNDAFDDAEGIASPSKVMKEKGQYIIKGLIEGIKSSMSELNTIVNKVADSFSSIGDSVTSNVTTEVSLKKDNWTSLDKFIGSASKTVPVYLKKSGWSSLSSFVGNATVSVGVKTYLTGTSIHNQIRDQIGNLKLKLIGTDGTETNAGYIKAYAKGGIVNSATLFGGSNLVGEAGAEAIVPLENNTQWLDRVADRIIGAMNAQSQQEVVNVSIDGEVFYRQMVKKNRQNIVRTGVNAFA